MKSQKGLVLVTVASVMAFIVAVYVIVVSIFSLVCGEDDEEEEFF